MLGSGAEGSIRRFRGVLYQRRERRKSILLMTSKEFLLEMDEILELPPGTLAGPERLEELALWNSTAMISFIALADTNHARISVRQIVGCTTVADLMRLAQAGNHPG